MNPRHDQTSGGNDRIALLLKAARVTTPAGNSRKARIAVTVAPPRRRRSFGKRNTSVLADRFERAGGRTQQRQRRECENKSGDRQTGREREVEARESELIDQVRDHVDATASDQLRGGECAESPGKRGGHAGDDSGRGERQRHGEEAADRTGAKARRGALVTAVDKAQWPAPHETQIRALAATGSAGR